MENKQFTFRSDKLQFKTEGKLKSERKYFIEGYASTTDKDLSGEVINDKAQASMLKQFRNRNITIDVEHEEWYDNKGKQLPKPKGTMIPVAKVIEAKLDSKGTWIKAEMNGNIERFDEVWGSIKGGFLNAFSIGFFPITQVGNVISDLNIVNLTLTGTPVNSEATFAPVLKSAVAYLKSLNETESETKMEEPKQEAVVPAVEAPVVPAPVVEAPVAQPVNELKSEEDIKAEVAKEVAIEVRKEIETPTVVEAKVETKESEISDLVGKIIETKLQEWETKFLKQNSIDEPKKETETEEPQAPQEVPSKPITPLGMIKAFEKRQGELGNMPKLKALVEETPTELTKQKTRSPLSLI